MKFFIGIVVAAVLLNDVLALPAGGVPNDDAEVIDTPRKADKDFRNFNGVIDTGSGYPFLQPMPHPFSFNLGFFDSFEDIFRRLRTHLWPLELPAGEGGDSTSLEDGGNSFSFNMPPRTGNTTSTVKVVDGHKVEINDTVYGDKNSVFKVRVVNIRPLESGEDAVEGSSVSSGATTAQPSGSPVTSAPAAADDDASDERREPLENKKPDENEIKGNIDEPEVKY